MPARKNATKQADEGELMEFEQFVSQQPKKQTNKSWLMITLVVIIVILAGAIYWLNQGKFAKEHKLQAVFLDSNQVYFARIVKEDSLNLYLDDVYYLDSQQQVVPATEEGGEDQVVNVPVLIKRGSEVHKPTGLLVINREKVVSVEAIGTDSDIMKEIERINSQPAQ